MPVERRMTILVVEDDPLHYELIERSVRSLERANVRYDLYWAKDGEEALDFLFRRKNYVQAPRPNLVLLDLYLPKKHGLDVLNEIKKDEKLRKIPVIVFTVSTDEEEMVRAYDSGAAGFLQKPASPEEFERLLATVWEYWRIAKLPD
ncbi:MAG: response regulator [Candidatus Bipolaricaulaceae bacterium]|nr:response regulator [Candidatus Bipolaricaulota bacterium]MCX7843957.1 response regulator [Candidatus Bipolaricaulota bacterium]MDW8151712.1 response regulator [Candidatus Bipolaricaulota bacterium]